MSMWQTQAYACLHLRKRGTARFSPNVGISIEETKTFTSNLNHFTSGPPGLKLTPNKMFSTHTSYY